MIRICWNDLHKEIRYKVTIGEKSMTCYTLEEAKNAEIDGAKKYRCGDSPMYKWAMEMLTK